MLAEIIAVAAVSSFVQGLSGFAFGLLATAFWAWILAPQQVVPLVVMSSLLGQIVSIAVVRSEIRFSRVSPYLAGGILGVPLGTLVLQMLNVLTFRASVGVCLVVFCFFMLRANKLPRIGANSCADSLIGFASGFMTGACGAGGPPMTLWCTLREGSAAVQRATFQSFFIVIQFQALVLLFWKSQLGMDVVKIFVWIAPVIVICSRLGSHCSRRFADAGFQKIVLILLLLSGVALAVPYFRHMLGG